MMENHEIDLSLAIQMQAQFEEELRVSLLKQEEERNQILVLHQGTPGPGKKNNWNRNGELNEPPQEKLSVPLTDSCWELIDPNPDIHTLFLTFNNQFFWGRLDGVEVRWSPRMTLCAGVCCYEGRGGLCSVRLSLPLLKLRPRKDLIETLLHEMIHAYLFVTANNRDRDGHGPEFHKHMFRINNVAGTKISVYHSFHDEVDEYRQHIWQCNGPCRQRRPYFGLVKRSMNRAPGPRDPWWQQHQQSCGGSYTKIQEPEGYVDKKKKSGSPPDKKGMANNGDIRKFFGKGKSLTGGSSSSQGSQNTQKSVGSGISPPMKENIPGYKGSKSNDINRNSSNANKTTNVHGFGSTTTGIVNPVNINNASKSKVHGFSGGAPANKKPRIGATGNGSKSSGGKSNGGGGLAVRGGTGSKTVTVKGKTASKAESETNNSSSERSALPSVTPFQGQGFSLGGQSSGQSRLLSLSSSSPQSSMSQTLTGQNQSQRSTASSSRSSNEYSFSSNLTSPEECDKRNHPKCPVCNLEFPVEEMNEHLDDCIGDFEDDDSEEWTTTPTMKLPPSRLTREFERSISISGDEGFDIQKKEKIRECSSSNAETQVSNPGETYLCPVCSEPVSASKINDHLDTHF